MPSMRNTKEATMTDAEKVAAVREILADFEWGSDDTQYALEDVTPAVGGWMSSPYFRDAVDT